MNFEDIVGKRKVNVSQLAREIGYNRSYLLLVINGKMKPGKKLAKALEKAFNGQITAEEMLNNYKELKK